MKKIKVVGIGGLGKTRMHIPIYDCLEEFDEEITKYVLDKIIVKVLSLIPITESRLFSVEDVINNLTFQCGLDVEVPCVKILRIVNKEMTKE